MSLINIERTIELDVYDHDTTPSVVKAIQLDEGTRAVYAVIQNSRQGYDIGQNAEVKLTVLRPDKTRVQIVGETFGYNGIDGTIYGAKAELSDVALAVKGNLKAQFKMTSGEQELRTEVFTISTGEALDAGDGDWAGDLDGHNLDEMAESIETLQTDMTAVNEDVSDLKSGFSNILEISNTASGTVSTAQTWENSHYTIKAGRTYTLYNKSATATISAYTRASEAGANIDLIGTIGTNQSKTFTASANANFLRIISTQAGSPWRVEEQGTKIYDIDADIDALETDKLDKVVYENKTTETVVLSGTFVNYPFMMSAGHTYLCTSLTPGNTLSFYTRATESGSNIDRCGPVGYGAPKTFTATEDANYIRVNSYLANGAFKIEDTGTASYRIDELQPKVPNVNLPSKLYATSGKELNVYFDNIIENSERYTYDITCAKGKQMQRGYSITPEDADAGTYDFTLNVLNDELETIATATATLTITASSAGSGTTKSFILLGDSTVNGTDTQIVNSFSTDQMAVTSLGTRGTAPASHEGRTGWMLQYYYNSASIGGITNPFYNPTSHLFDADYYFTNSGVAKPDWFFIQLGINDVFLPTDDDALNSKINTMVTQCNYIVNSIKSASANTKIGIAVTIPPNRSQDAFGKAYGCGQTRARYKHNNTAWVKRLLAEYTGMEADNIYLIPICTNLDTTYNMGLESVPVNARNTDNTYLSPIANGGVHPVESGYKQLADVYTAFLKAMA